MNYLKQSKNILAVMIILSLVLPAFLSFSNNIARAQDAPPSEEDENPPGGDTSTTADVATATLLCTGALNSITGFLNRLIPSTEVPVAETAERKKEICLDHIAFLLANRLIEKIAKDTVNWINGTTGKGGPRYIRDLDGFLKDIADEAIGEYISTTDFGFVCDPFKLQLKASLAKLKAKPAKKVECTLSEITKNVDDFINGNFKAGGWEAWGELSTNSNPYIQYLGAQNEIEFKIKGKKDVELIKLEWGQGFFGWEVCQGERYVCNISGKKEPWPTGQNKKSCEEFGGNYQCAVPTTIATPGSVVEEQLNKVLSSGQNRLEIADEVNEVLSALLSKLINDVLGPKGLSGYRPRAGTSFDPDSLCNNYGVCAGGPGSGGEYEVCVKSCDQKYCTTPAGPNNETPPSCQETELAMCIAGCAGATGTGAYVKHTTSAVNNVIIEAHLPSLSTLPAGTKITIRVDGTDKFSCVYTPCKYSNNYADGDYTYDAGYLLDGALQRIGGGRFTIPTPVVVTPPPGGGDPFSDLKTERAKFGARISMAEAGRILNIVAWNNRAAGWGLSRKEGGSKCPSLVGNIACDVLYHKPSNTLYDVFIAGPNDSCPVCEARPTWDRLGPNTDQSRPWVAPAQP